MIVSELCVSPEKSGAKIKISYYCEQSYELSICIPHRLELTLNTRRYVVVGNGIPKTNSIKKGKVATYIRCAVL